MDTNEYFQIQKKNMDWYTQRKWHNYINNFDENIYLGTCNTLSSINNELISYWYVKKLLPVLFTISEDI
ncbi:MAG: hypothetical protein IJ848_00760 [Alphaproteobacteria bacterium]|nr:hypothetical protein [Alphaproteobacteria bacterium]